MFNPVSTAVRQACFVRITLIFAIAVGCGSFFSACSSASEGESRADSADSTADWVRVSGKSNESSDTTPEIRVFFTDPESNREQISRGYHPDSLHSDIESALIEFLGSATTTLDVALFELESPSAAAALTSAQRRGVRVRVVLEDDYAGNVLIDSLRQTGIPIVTDRRSGYMHNKFVVADSESVWTGSTNLTERGLHTNDNASIIVHSRLFASNYLAEFEEMFVDSSFGPTSPAGSPHSAVQLNNAHVSVWFGPEDEIESKLLRYLRAAKNDIAFLSFAFTSDPIGLLLVEKFTSGVNVRGVIETRSARFQSSELERLRSAGVDVLEDGNPYTMHHKFMVIDTTWTIVGSNNLSRNATERNDENMVVVKSRDVALQFLREFERVRTVAHDR